MGILERSTERMGQVQDSFYREEQKVCIQRDVFWINERTSYFQPFGEQGFSGVSVLVCTMFSGRRTVLLSQELHITSVPFESDIQEDESSQLEVQIAQMHIRSSADSFSGTSGVKRRVETRPEED